MQLFSRAQMFNFMAIAIAVCLALSTSLPAALAQYSSTTYGPAPMMTAPNYWGDARINNTGYGDYRNPYTGQPVYDNGTVNTKSTLPAGFSGTYYDNQRGRASTGGGFNPMGLVVGGGMIGGAALMMSAGRLANLRSGGLGHSTESPAAYQKAQKDAEKRRQTQEEKIRGELAKAHQDNMKKRGLIPDDQDDAMSNNLGMGNGRPAPMAQAQGAVPAQMAGAAPINSQPQSMVSESGLAADKFKNSALPDIEEGDTAKALSF